MNEIGLWLDKLVAWIDRCGPPIVPFAGRALGGYFNPPAPHIELVLLGETGVDSLRIGDRTTSIPPRHAVLHSVHLGAFTPAMQRMDSWCVFVDVRGEREFEPLGRMPLCCAIPVERHAELAAAFERVGACVTRYGTGPRHYLAPEPLYDPRRDRGVGGTPAIHVKAALLELVALMIDEARADAEPSRTRAPRAVQAAAEFIDLSYRDSALALDDVADAARLSADHLGRLFRQHTGETPMQRLKHTRVNQSRFLLEHTSLRVEEVAREVGFEDQFHFSRVFRAVTGISPSEWRDRRNAGDGRRRRIGRRR